MSREHNVTVVMLERCNKALRVLCVTIDIFLKELQHVIETNVHNTSCNGRLHNKKHVYNNTQQSPQLTKISRMVTVYGADATFATGTMYIVVADTMSCTPTLEYWASATVAGGTHLF